MPSKTKEKDYLFTISAAFNEQSERIRVARFFVSKLSVAEALNDFHDFFSGWHDPATFYWVTCSLQDGESVFNGIYTPESNRPFFVSTGLRSDVSGS